MATTVSAYQGRSHLAQPARCLDHEYSYSYSELPLGSVESRRRRLLSRCSEHQHGAEAPHGAKNHFSRELGRNQISRELKNQTSRELGINHAFRELGINSNSRELGKCQASRELGKKQPLREFQRVKEPPKNHNPREARGQARDAPEVSVRRRSEELVRAVRGGEGGARLTVESGWSKVEEVRKKFEDAAGAGATFSRSFESPPRRRLADSLFASFKLPRRKETASTPEVTEGGTMTSQTRLQPQHKRKSAVELLAESKAFYVKSETVLDRKQELPLRMSSGLGQAIAAGGCLPVVSSNVNPPVCCQPYGNTMPRPLSTPGAARRAPPGDGLQSTLRRLLDNSEKTVYWQPVYAVPHKLRPSHTATLPVTPKHRRECDRRIDTSETVGACSIPSSLSSVDGVSVSGALERLGAISPPAQYAHARYGRSNSQTSATVRRGSAEEESNINSHKSLPDLHTHVSVSACGAETPGRSPRRRRHSTHQRTASCSSKGTRSNHSSLVSSCEAFSEHPSPGEDCSYNRCGSSFARDSGGSSGHYTQRSAPPAARPRAQRTDSNSSGQHSHTRSYYASAGYADDGLPVWPVCAPPQFQDGAPSPPSPPHLPPPPRPAYHDARVQIHFQARAPPPQFQDEPPPPDERPARCRPRDYRYELSPEETPRKTAIYSEPRPHRATVDSVEYVNTVQMQGLPPDATSPLGTFKRQRCLRYKQRRPRPVLRSKSDISDSRYRRCDGRGPASAPTDDDSPDSDQSSTKLNHFFTHLGLDQRTFENVINCSPAKTDSPVFFSDVSTVDSNQMVLATDYTVQGPQKQIYRNAEPPSVVERNARIVKWLCNCRKQLAQ